MDRRDRYHVTCIPWGLRYATIELCFLCVVRAERIWEFTLCKLVMICSVKHVLKEDLCVMQKEEFSITCYMCEIYSTFDERPSIFIRDKHISSERMLHKDYYRKNSVGKKSLVMGLKGSDAKTNCLAVYHLS
jgi:hypothetical protein